MVAIGFFLSMTSGYGMKIKSLLFEGPRYFVVEVAARWVEISNEVVVFKVRTNGSPVEEFVLLSAASFAS